jgi:glycosyltransferase involved in cell wall biosynthesis
VCAKYEVHPKVKLVRRERNGGLSAARNTGLALSDAHFIQFWDADDIYYGEALEQLVEAAIVGMSDIVTGIADRSGEVLPAYRLSQTNMYALKQPFCHLAFQTMSTCFKLYRRDFLTKHRLTFVEGLYMQDTEFNLRAFASADSVSMTDAIIGEYVDAGANRGSQHVTEARMRSALEIYQRASSMIDSQPRVPVEYSDFIILKFVFRFFVVKLLTPEQFAENFDISVDRTHYLAQFRAYIRNMSPGIRRFFSSPEKNDWRWGLAFALMQVDDDETATKILRLGNFQPSWAQDVAAKVSEQIELDYALVLKRISMIGKITV